MKKLLGLLTLVLFSSPLSLAAENPLVPASQNQIQGQNQNQNQSQNQSKTQVLNQGQNQNRSQNQSQNPIQIQNQQTTVATSQKNTGKASKRVSLDRKFSDRREVQQFIWDLYVKHKLNIQQLKQLLKIAPDPKVIQKISKPFEEVTWPVYREKFVNDERAKAGVQFWKENQAALKKAEQDFGIPAEMIVAIIGVETYYGRNTGNFLAVQALATLAFDYPPRSQFFKNELEQFFLLINEEKLDGKTILGSYAGALGLPQFMPSSYRRYAVDFSGHGKRDLINSTTDAIGSVANYFKEHGWISGQPVAYPAQVYGSEYQRLANTNMKDPVPKLTLEAYSRFNIQPKDKNGLKNNKDAKASFIMLKSDDYNPELWLTLQNFYVITRYNHSVNYAMAVYQLSQRIRELNQKG